MRIEYLTVFKWENLPDGTQEKFIYRLDACIWELSLQKHKLGCYDMCAEFNIPEKFYDDKTKQLSKNAKLEYKKRAQKIEQLIELIKHTVPYNKLIDNEYLYELWISRIFELNWTKQNYDITLDIDLLIEALSQNPEINPFEIDLSKSNIKPKQKKKSLFNIRNFFKKI